MITIKKNGITSQNRSSPLSFWKNEDIFAYIAKYNLPLHPNYAMLGGGKYKRKNIRVGAHFMGIQKGNGEWEREYYQDVLNKLEKGLNIR